MKLLIRYRNEDFYLFCDIRCLNMPTIHIPARFDTVQFKYVAKYLIVDDHYDPIGLFERKSQVDMYLNLRGLLLGGFNGRAYFFNEYIHRTYRCFDILSI